MTGETHDSEQSLSSFYRLYDCFDIQTEPETPVPEIARFMEANGTARIDHIFISEEFKEISGYKTGRIKTMTYPQNEGNPDRPELLDRHPVLVTIALR